MKKFFCYIAKYAGAIATGSSGVASLPIANDFDFIVEEIRTSGVVGVGCVIQNSTGDNYSNMPFGLGAVGQGQDGLKIAGWKIPKNSNLQVTFSNGSGSSQTGLEVQLWGYKTV